MKNAIPNQFNDHTRQLLEALGNSINGIIIIDHQLPDDPIIYCNPVFTEMTGYKAEEILGRNCRFLQGELREQEGRFKILEALQQGKECTVELLNFRKDGSSFQNEIFISPIRNNEGQVTHFIGIQNKSLSFQKQKDDFINSASHELKTPVTSLKAVLQLLRQFENDPDKQMPPGLISQANKSVEKVESLIEDLLNTAKYRDGQLQLDKSKFDLAKLIHDCCPHIRFEGKYNIVMQGDVQLEVYADPKRINQVIENLISNARKFAPAAQNIKVSLTHNAEFARVFVMDQGPGIPKDEQQHVFERYYKANVSSQQFGGMGLGLFISREIILLHGGEIGVESEPGLGTSFWFTLPIN